MIPRKKTTILLDPELYQFGKEYAREEQISFSDLINRYLLQLKRASKNNLSEVVNNLQI